MRDTTLYEHLLGIKYPWMVSKVELSPKSNGSMFGSNILKESNGPARNAGLKGRSTIMRKKGSGGIWTAASSRPSCMPLPPGFGVCSTESVR